MSGRRERGAGRRTGSDQRRAARPGPPAPITGADAIAGSGSPVVGQPLEVGDHRLDLQLGGCDPAAAPPDQHRRSPHPLGQVVEIDGLTLQLAEDPLQLGQGGAVTEALELGRLIGGGTRLCAAGSGFSLGLTLVAHDAASTRLVACPVANVVSNTSPGWRLAPSRTIVPSGRRVMLQPRASARAGSRARTRASMPSTRRPAATV